MNNKGFFDFDWLEDLPIGVILLGVIGAVVGYIVVSRNVAAGQVPATYKYISAVICGAAGIGVGWFMSNK